MKALFIVLSLFTSSLAFSAEGPIVLDCRKETMSGPRKRVQAMTMTANADPSAQLHVFDCTAFANWGCNSADIDQTYLVTTVDGANYQDQWNLVSVRKVQDGPRVQFILKIANSTEVTFSDKECHFSQ